MRAELHEVAEGLRRPQKELSPKYFYDAQGSALFEAITRLPEYYPSRSERALLETFVPGWIEEWAPRSLVELGAGAATKTRILLDTLQRVATRATYVPVDISADFLDTTARTLRREYPQLSIRPVVADMSARLDLPREVPRPAVFALLGGTIGNFREPDAIALLARLRSALGQADRLLLGADLVKETDVLERAYNDGAGVTAAFNLNILTVLNREIGTDFDPSAFRHRAFYAPDRRRIEMHLVAQRPLVVTLPGAGTVRFAPGETVRTEISCKYDRPVIADMLRAAGLELERWVEGPDPRERFGLAVARAAGTRASRD